MSNNGLAPIVTLSRGGWMTYHPTVTTPSGGRSQARTSGYGDRWREYLSDMTADAIGVDTTAIPDSEIVTWATAGPMVNPDIPAGHVRAFVSGRDIPWSDTPAAERDARFGNARSLDYVAVDVYVTLARRFGARIFNPHAEVTRDDSVLTDIPRPLTADDLPTDTYPEV